MNPKSFFSQLTTFVEGLAETLPRFTPQSILQAEALIQHHFSLPAQIILFGFDPTLHFKIGLAVDPSVRSVRVNCVPLTLVGLEMLMAQSGVVIDESIRKRIRHLQDQQVVQEVLSAGRQSSMVAESECLKKPTESFETSMTTSSECTTDAGELPAVSKEKLVVEDVSEKEFVKIRNTEESVS